MNQIYVMYNGTNWIIMIGNDHYRLTPPVIMEYPEVIFEAITTTCHYNNVCDYIVKHLSSDQLIELQLKGYLTP